MPYFSRHMNFLYIVVGKKCDSFCNIQPAKKPISKCLLFNCLNKPKIFDDSLRENLVMFWLNLVMYEKTYVKLIILLLCLPVIYLEIWEGN